MVSPEAERDFIGALPARLPARLVSAFPHTRNLQSTKASRARWKFSGGKKSTGRDGLLPLRGCSEKTSRGATAVCAGA